MLLVLQPFFFFFSFFLMNSLRWKSVLVSSRGFFGEIADFRFFFFFLNRVLDVSSREILEIGDAVS